MSVDARIDRGLVWKQLGAPTDQVGSVNDPRTHEEHGLKWNEKWIYRSEHGGEAYPEFVFQEQIAPPELLDPVGSNGNH